MIKILYGNIGGGKSYTATEKFIIPHLLSGGYIATNVALKLPELGELFEKSYGYKLPLKNILILSRKGSELREFYRHTPSNCLLILDEVHLWFNARDWADCSRDLLGFLSQSRKYKTDILFISQDPDNVDKQFRRLCSEYICVSSFIGWIFPDTTPRWLCPFYLHQVWDKNRKRLKRWRIYIYSKKIFAVYDTYAIYGDGFERLEVERQELEPVSGSGAWRMKVFVLVGLLVVMGFGGWFLWGKTGGEKKKTIVTASLPVSVIPQGLPDVPKVETVLGQVSGNVNGVLTTLGWYYVGETSPQGFRVVGVSRRGAFLETPDGIQLRKFGAN